MKALRSVAWLSLAFCLLALGPAACDDTTNPSGDPSTAGSEPGIRIISLSPALTRMIQDLGGGGLIVGGDDSHLQVFEKFSPPTVGQFNRINTEAIIALRPTHVVAMVGAEGVPAELDKLANTNGFKLLTYPYPTNVREVDAIMRGAAAMPQAGKSLVAEDSLAHLLGNELKGQMIANEMNIKLGQIDALTAQIAPPGKKPRVLLVMELQPQVRAFGPGTVMHDVLSNYTGGYNAAIPDLKPLSAEDQKDPAKVKAWYEAAAKDPADLVGTAPVLDRERLLDAKPDVIVLILPGEPALDIPDLDPRLADFRGLDIPAVKNDRIVLINSRESQLPSTSLPLIAAELAKAIHPSLAEQIDKVNAPPAEVEPEKPESDPDTSENVQPRTSASADGPF